MVRALGWNIPSDAALSLVSHEAAAAGEPLVDEAARDVRLWPSARLGFARALGWPGSTPVRLIAHASSALEPPSADAAGQPVLLEMPATVTGCLTAAGEVDEYRVNLSTGQHIVVAAEAPSLQLPTAPIVQLLDAAGAVVAETPNSGPVKDAILAHSTKTDGEYVIRVRDRFRRGGDRYWYQLSVHADQSNVQLTADADAIIVKPDAPAELNVTLARHSAPSQPLGEIKLEAIDLPAGVTAEPVVSGAEGPTAEKVTIRFTSTGPAFSGPIRVRATTGEPLGLVRFVRAPSKYPSSTAAIWLTVAEAE
jgi:hypothetical protein